MLTQPALSADRVAFVYGNDVWTSRLDGTGVQRITSGPGTKTSPAFSPDGALLAFSAELDGNMDVFVVPAVGGIPKRLTWHPSRDTVQGFTPDGKAVLFSSPREAFNNRHDQLYTVPTGRRSPTPRTARGTSSGSATAAARSRGSGSTTSRRTPS
jgi:tricorn protease